MPLFFMKNLYSIIIPVFNEKLKIDILLKNLEDYSCYGHEILVVINDGSTDGSKDILLGCSFIKLITYEKNKGKGNAIIKGLQAAKNEKIVIFDGDLEINPIKFEN